ncbi:hypothetical protein R8Z50_21640 [Longispora sp. K20-0274]|uniref:hypothetical protein n=1 Tax=Longispora sp. K20-0274 TaxID=3088255 RepID=UPI0039998BDC
MDNRSTTRVRALAVIALATAVSGGLLLAPASPATAAPAAGVASSVEFTGTSTPGTATSITEQYAATRADHGRGKAAKERFIRESATTDGRYYDADFVDYLKLTPNGAAPVEVVVPRDYHVDAVQVTNTATGGVTAGIRGSEGVGAENALVYPQGPGFAFSSVSSGTYTLNTSRGNLKATWWKLKDTGDTSGTYDWWMYKRKSVATPADPGFWGDFVGNMGMRSYPSTATRSILKGWVDHAPAIGSFTGGCGPDVALNVGGGSITYKSCANYQVDWNANTADAGDFSVNWTNSFWGETGPQEMADIVVVKTAQGKTPYYNDYQYVNFESAVDRHHTGGCGSTNSSANC